MYPAARRVVGSEKTRKYLTLEPLQVRGNAVLNEARFILGL